MFRQLKEKKAGVFIEYTVMLILIISSLVIFRNYFFRGLACKWKSLSDNFAFGRQYDPKRTLECVFDYQFTDTWYEAKCFEAHFEERGCEVIRSYDEYDACLAIKEEIIRQCGTERDQGLGEYERCNGHDLDPALVPAPEEGPDPDPEE
ncbi:MAG: hypothetical protein GY861_23840 [bacterium]|nr:hypothetical protein [bacterium]